MIFTVSYYIATLLQNWTLTSENKITCYCSQLGLARCVHISTTDEVAIGHDFNYIGFINVYVAYALINVFSHHPSPRDYMGQHTLMSNSPQWGKQSMSNSQFAPVATWGYGGDLTYPDIKCPIVGQMFCVNAPSKAPLRPEGGWWGNALIGALYLYK